MKDRFKFRFWDKKEKEYFTCGNIDHESGIFKTYPYRTYNWCFGHKNIIAEQCTGLKDRNGTLIYEGDIVKTEQFGEVTIYQVIWDMKTAKFLFENKYISFSFDDLPADVTEIISNIHENKELLNG